MHLTEEQTDFWDMLSHEYPSLKTCWNCKNIRLSDEIDYPCYYSKNNKCCVYVCDLDEEERSLLVNKHWKWRYAPD